MSSSPPPDRPQHEFGGTGGDEFLDARHDGRAVAGDDAVVRVALEARRVGFGRPLHERLLPAPEAEVEARAVVVVIDAPAGLDERLLDRGDRRRHLFRRLQPRLPAGAEARRAPDRRTARAAEPERQDFLHRLGLDRGAAVAVELALEIDRVLGSRAGR